METNNNNNLSENTQNIISELKKQLNEKEAENQKLKERIEADRNAIMQIQFEAHQHKQEEIDLHYTNIWRTGLMIEKIFQKIGISFIRSLLVLSDYKRIGLRLTLRKGFAEVFHRENVTHNKKRKMELGRAKVNKFKIERTRVFGS
ncbi:MAG: hypothetical protein IJN96_07880, partial [Clostridia bacterium]|nr:hypothetical protein [Clostridia bacterium]